MSWFGLGKEVPQIPEEGPSDLTTADIPRPRKEIGTINMEDEKANSAESRRSFLAAVRSLEDVLDKREGVHLLQKKVNGENVMSSEGFDILRSDLNKRIGLLKKQFEAWLVDQANMEAFGNARPKSDDDDEREAWKG